MSRFEYKNKQSHLYVTYFYKDHNIKLQCGNYCGMAKTGSNVSIQRFHPRTHIFKGLHSKIIFFYNLYFHSHSYLDWIRLDFVIDFIFPLGFSEKSIAIILSLIVIEWLIDINICQYFAGWPLIAFTEAVRSAQPTLDEAQINS